MRIGKTFFALLLIILLINQCRTGDNASIPKNKYNDLVQIFHALRGLQEPILNNGVPDYSVEAMARQYSGLKDLKMQLILIDTSGWTVSNRVDYHLVKGEMAALLSALVIIPAIFAYGFDLAAGPPLLFIILPEIFSTMPGGRLFSVMFFTGVLFAALSSLINMMEIIVESLMDQFQWTRRTTVGLVAISGFICGIPLAIDMSLFTKFVDIVTVYFTPLGAAMAAFLFFWIHPIEKARLAINSGAQYPVGSWWNPMAKYGYVGVAILVILLQIFYRIG